MVFLDQNIDAAIFDMDGTMLDTERLRMKMLQDASAMIYGESLPESLLFECLGISAKASEELAKQRYGEDYPYKEIRKKADELEVNYVRTNGAPVKPGLIDVLERFKRNDLLLAVATSSKRAIAEEYLILAGIMKYFDVVVCGDEITKGKPNPDIFLKAASELNCDPANCIIMEDSENGLIAASDAGAFPIYIRDMKLPRPEIHKKALKSYDTFEEFLNDLIPITKKMPVPKLNEHFPQSYNNLTVGIHGFGAMGGGYITQIFSHWDGYTRPFKIIAAARNNTILQFINTFGKYSVAYGSVAFYQTIRNVHIIDMGEEADMINMYEESCMVAICIPEAAISKQAGIIAKGLIARHKKTGVDLTLLVILNKIGGGTYLKGQVEKALLNQTDAETVKEILSKTYFSETVVNRMVSVVPKSNVIKQIKRYIKHQEIAIRDSQLCSVFEGKEDVDTYLDNSNKNSQSEESKIFDQLDKITQLNNEFAEENIVLFRSEPDMVLYASDVGPYISSMRQIKVVPDIKVLQHIKNRLSNGTHAIIAWYSSLLGYKNIGQGMGDDNVQGLVEDIIKDEIKPFLLDDYPHYEEYINHFMHSFIKRCRSSFKDPCKRVGRDPIRKLKDKERILGTIKAAKDHNIKTPNLEFGAATGFAYAILQIDTSDKESQFLNSIYEKNKSLNELLTYKGTYNGKEFSFFDPENDADLIENISKEIEKLIK